MTSGTGEWTAYGRTERGLVRSNNQDALLVDNRHRLWAVADGMGGHPGGDVASRLVVNTLADFAPAIGRNAASSAGTEDDAAFSCATMVEQAHANVLAHAARHPELEGMGTTLVAAHILLLPAPRLLVMNVGDSRAYLIRDDTITQLTRDHTIIEAMIREGRLSPEQAAHHPERHVLTRAMGLGPTIESDLFPLDLIDGDLILLCSDGLTKMLSDQQILQTVLPHRRNPSLSTHALIESALETGGIDNVTVVACALPELPRTAIRH